MSDVGDLKIVHVSMEVVQEKPKGGMLTKPLFKVTTAMTQNDVSVLHSTVQHEKETFELTSNFESEESLLSYGANNAVVTPSWKLSYFPEYNEGRLFDRIADPAEQEDLFNSTKHEAVKTGLLTALLRWRAQQDPIQWIQANSRPGAETATLAYEHTSSLRGTDAEIRLQEDALKFEPR